MTMPRVERKTCRACGESKPVDEFYKGRLCKKCDNTKPRHASLAKTINHRARIRAQKRLQDAHPDEFRDLFDEELVKAESEAAMLQAVADFDDAVVQLRSGPRTVGETATDRIREDVGKCPLCINRHDRDHVCPSCGSRPQVVAAQVVQPARRFRVAQT